MKSTISGLLAALVCLCLLPAARGQQMGWQSARRFGGQDQQAGQPNQLRATAADRSGNYYVVGIFQALTDFGGLTRVSEGYSAGFVAKYNSAGVVQWVNTLTGPVGSALDAVCVNPAGGCYVVGQFFDQATLDGVHRLSGSGIVTAAYDDNGLLTWSDVTTQNAIVIEVKGVALDAQGRCYVAGNIGPSTCTFGAVTVTFPTSAQAGGGPFVCCYGRNRQVSWVKATTVTYAESGPFGIVGTNNGCVVSAYYAGKAAVVLGVATDSTRGAYLPSQSDQDGLVVALDSSGAPLWSRTIVNPFMRVVLTPPLVSGEQVLVAGAADTLTTFSQSSVSFTGPRFAPKTFVAGYDLTTGTLDRVEVLAQGIRAPGSPYYGSATPTALFENPNGLYLGGELGGEIQFGALPPVAAASPTARDGFVAKFSPSTSPGGATCEWVVPATTTPTGIAWARTSVKGVMALPTGEVWAAGEFYPQASLGSFALQAVSSGDLFMGRIGQVLGVADESLAATAAAVWPNPAREAAWLRSPFAAGAGTATVLDALGRPVRTVAVGAEPVRFDCAGLPGGVYTVLFQASGRRATHRLVVQP